MLLLPLLLLSTAWFFRLLATYRTNAKAIAALLLAMVVQLAGVYLICQTGIRADEQGTSGNLLGDPIAVWLLASGLVIFVVQEVSKKPGKLI